MNQYNEHGLKEGYWEDYYVNGNLMYKGNYNNGKSVGYWEEYYVNGNGNLWCKGVYINGLKDGYWEEYYFNGKLSRKGYFVNNKLHGYWEEYNGELPDKEFYL